MVHVDINNMSSRDESSSKDTGFPLWDPKSPGQWFSVAGSGNEIIVTNNDSDTGAGCNIFETSALINLLDARDEYLENKSAIGSYLSMQKLCRKYCQILSQCCVEWDEYLQHQHQHSNNETSDTMAMDDHILVESSLSLEGLEFLKIVYALTQLSGTYLLLPKTRGPVMSGLAFNHFADIVKIEGAATADTIRFLRLHCLGPADGEYKDSDLDDLNESFQPDQLDGGYLYWTLVEKHVIRGCLEDAWMLLSNHSMFKCLQDNDMVDNEIIDDFDRVSMKEYRDGFLTLKSVLLSAPLPGGRNSSDDAGFVQQADGYERDDLSLENQDYIEEIPSTAYRFWDVSASLIHPSNMRYHFEPRRAFGYWKDWKSVIRHNAELRTLRSRIPQLSSLLDILTGNFEQIEFGSWQEELCCELLYESPYIKLDDVHSRTIAMMKKHNGQSLNSLEKGIGRIMKGNAGRVIDLASSFGGATSAALPAVMTALLAQILSDAEALREDEMKECIIHAASAIWSSFAVEAEGAVKIPKAPTDQRDVGARLTARLLLPFIQVGSDVRYTATLVDMLEHHFPENDAEANNLLSFCQKLVERQNVRILDGCDSICLARYLHYKREEKPAGAVRWLVKGIELEALLLCGPERTGAWQTLLFHGLCFRKLVADCFDTAQSMLKYIIGDYEEGSASMMYDRARAMISAQETSPLTPFVPAVKILDHVATMARATSERSGTKIIANCIVECLEERANDEDDGTVFSLAPPCMQWDLLRLATLMLERDAAKGDMEATASFDVKGVGVLLSAFFINVEYMKVENRIETISSERIYKMRLALAEGLKRAYIAENAMKATAPKLTATLSAEGKYGAKFDNYSREVQELAVQNMLDQY